MMAKAGLRLANTKPILIVKVTYPGGVATVVQYKSRAGLVGPGSGPGFVLPGSGPGPGLGYVSLYDGWGCRVYSTAGSLQLSPRLFTNSGGYSLIENT